MQDSEGFPIGGVVRFSVLTHDYYSETYDTAEKLAAHLFSPERLDLRFRLFEALCLATLSRQTDPDFRCTVLTSTLLPEAERARLEALIAPYPQFSVLAAEPQKHYPLTRRAYEAATPAGAKRRMWFRIDDDDAVALDYIARLRRIGTCLDALHPDESFAIAFNRGFYVEVDGKPGENKLLDCTERTPLSVGTAVLAAHKDNRTPYRYNHRMLGQRYNLYTDISAPVFLRSVHADNKSDPARQGPSDTLERDEVERQIRERFGLDPAMLRAL